MVFEIVYPNRWLGDFGLHGAPSAGAGITRLELFGSTLAERSHGQYIDLVFYLRRAEHGIPADAWRAVSKREGAMAAKL